MPNVRNREDPDVLKLEQAHAEMWKAREAAHNAEILARVGKAAFHPESLKWDSVWDVIPDGSIPDPPAEIVQPTAQEVKASAQVEEAIAEMIQEYRDLTAAGKPWGGGNFRGQALPATEENYRNEALRLVPLSHATAWVRHVGYLTRRDAWYTARDRHIGGHHGMKVDMASLHATLGCELPPDDVNYQWGRGELHIHVPPEIAGRAGAVLYLRAGLNEPVRRVLTTEERIAALEAALVSKA